MDKSETILGSPTQQPESNGNSTLYGDYIRRKVALYDTAMDKVKESEEQLADDEKEDYRAVMEENLKDLIFNDSTQDLYTGDQQFFSDPDRRRRLEKWGDKFNYRPELSTSELERRLGNSQSTASKIINEIPAFIESVAGSGLSEVGSLGAQATIRQMGAVEAENGRLLTGTVLSRLGDEITKDVQDRFPVYSREWKGNGAFRPLDIAWWFNDFLNSQAFTWATMLLTGGLAAGATRLASLLKIPTALNTIAKSSKAAGIITSAATELATSGMLATISRQGESYIEAAQTYEEAYQKYIDLGYDEMDARRAASLAATSNYNKNWWLLAQDTFTYLIAGRIATAKFMKKGLAAQEAMVTNKLNRQFNKFLNIDPTTGVQTVDKKALRRMMFANRLLDASGEGLLEEGLQYATNKQGIDIGEAALRTGALDQYTGKNARKVYKGVVDDTDVRTALGSYFSSLDEGQFWSGVVGGALGSTFGVELFARLTQSSKEAVNKQLQDILNEDSGAINAITNLANDIYESQAERIVRELSDGELDAKMFNDVKLMVLASKLSPIVGMRELFSNILKDEKSGGLSAEELNKRFGLSKEAVDAIRSLSDDEKTKINNYISKVDAAFEEKAKEVVKSINSKITKGKKIANINDLNLEDKRRISTLIAENVESKLFLDLYGEESDFYKNTNKEIDELTEKITNDLIYNATLDDKSTIADKIKKLFNLEENKKFFPEQAKNLVINRISYEIESHKHKALEEEIKTTKDKIAEYDNAIKKYGADNTLTEDQLKKKKDLIRHKEYLEKTLPEREEELKAKSKVLDKYKEEDSKLYEEFYKDIVEVRGAADQTLDKVNVRNWLGSSITKIENEIARVLNNTDKNSDGYKLMDLVDTILAIQDATTDHNISIKQSDFVLSTMPDLIANSINNPTTKEQQATIISNIRNRLTNYKPGVDQLPEGVVPTLSNSVAVGSIIKIGRKWYLVTGIAPKDGAVDNSFGTRVSRDNSDYSLQLLEIDSKKVDKLKALLPENLESTPNFNDKAFDEFFNAGKLSRKQLVDIKGKMGNPHSIYDSLRTPKEQLREHSVSLRTNPDIDINIDDAGGEQHESSNTNRQDDESSSATTNNEMSATYTRQLEDGSFELAEPDSEFEELVNAQDEATSKLWKQAKVSVGDKRKNYPLRINRKKQSSDYLNKQLSILDAIGASKEEKEGFVDIFHAINGYTPEDRPDTFERAVKYMNLIRDRKNSGNLSDVDSWIIKHVAICVNIEVGSYSSKDKTLLYIPEVKDNYRKVVKEALFDKRYNILNTVLSENGKPIESIGITRTGGDVQTLSNPVNIDEKFTNTPDSPILFGIDAKYAGEGKEEVKFITSRENEKVVNEKFGLQSLSERMANRANTQNGSVFVIQKAGANGVFDSDKAIPVSTNRISLPIAEVLANCLYNIAQVFAYNKKGIFSALTKYNVSKQFGKVNRTLANGDPNPAYDRVWNLLESSGLLAKLEENIIDEQSKLKSDKDKVVWDKNSSIFNEFEKEARAIIEESNRTTSNINGEINPYIIDAIIITKDGMELSLNNFRDENGEISVASVDYDDLITASNPRMHNLPLLTVVGMFMNYSNISPLRNKKELRVENDTRVLFESTVVSDPSKSIRIVEVTEKANNGVDVKTIRIDYGANSVIVHSESTDPNFKYSATENNNINTINGLRDFAKWISENRYYNINASRINPLDEVTGKFKPINKSNWSIKDSNGNVVFKVDEGDSYNDVLYKSGMLYTNFDRYTLPVLSFNLPTPTTTSTIVKGDDKSIQQPTTTPKKRPAPRGRVSPKRGVAKEVVNEELDFGGELSKISKEQAVNNVLDRVGIKTSDVRVVPALMLQLSKGRKAWGLFNGDCIYITSGAPTTVLYHEAFHRVSNVYLSDTLRNNLYRKAKTYYNLPNATDVEIEERLADEFMAYVGSKDELESKYKTPFGRAFARIKAFGKIVLGLSSDESAIEELFNIMARGAYEKYTPKKRLVSEFKEKFSSLPRTIDGTFVELNYMSPNDGELSRDLAIFIADHILANKKPKEIKDDLLDKVSEIKFKVSNTESFYTELLKKVMLSKEELVKFLESDEYLDIMAELLSEELPEGSKSIYNMYVDENGDIIKEVNMDVVNKLMKMSPENRIEFVKNMQVFESYDDTVHNQLTLYPYNIREYIDHFNHVGEVLDRFVNSRSNFKRALREIGANIKNNKTISFVDYVSEKDWFDKINAIDFRLGDDRSDIDEEGEVLSGQSDTKSIEKHKHDVAVERIDARTSALNIAKNLIASVRATELVLNKQGEPEIDPITGLPKYKYIISSIGTTRPCSFIELDRIVRDTVYKNGDIIDIIQALKDRASDWVRYGNISGELQQLVDLLEYHRSDTYVNENGETVEKTAREKRKSSQILNAFFSGYRAYKVNAVELTIERDADVSGRGDSKKHREASLKSNEDALIGTIRNAAEANAKDALINHIYTTILHNEKIFKKDRVKTTKSTQVITYNNKSYTSEQEIITSNSYPSGYYQWRNGKNERDGSVKFTPSFDSKTGTYNWFDFAKNATAYDYAAFISLLRTPLPHGTNKQSWNGIDEDNAYSYGAEKDSKDPLESAALILMKSFAKQVFDLINIRVTDFDVTRFVSLIQEKRECSAVEAAQVLLSNLNGLVDYGSEMGDLNNISTRRLYYNLYSTMSDLAELYFEVYPERLPFSARGPKNNNYYTQVNTSHVTDSVSSLSAYPETAKERVEVVGNKHSRLLKGLVADKINLSDYLSEEELKKLDTEEKQSKKREEIARKNAKQLGLVSALSLKTRIDKYRDSGREVVELADGEAFLVDFSMYLNENKRDSRKSGQPLLKINAQPRSSTYYIAGIRPFKNQVTFNSDLSRGINKFVKFGFGHEVLDYYWERYLDELEEINVNKAIIQQYKDAKEEYDSKRKDNTASIEEVKKAFKEYLYAKSMLIENRNYVVKKGKIIVDEKDGVVIPGLHLADFIGLEAIQNNYTNNIVDRESFNNIMTEVLNNKIHDYINSLVENGVFYINNNGVAVSDVIGSDSSNDHAAKLSIVNSDITENISIDAEITMNALYEYARKKGKTINLYGKDSKPEEGVTSNSSFKELFEFIEQEFVEDGQVKKVPGIYDKNVELYGLKALYEFLKARKTLNSWAEPISPSMIDGNNLKVIGDSFYSRLRGPYSANSTAVAQQLQVAEFWINNEMSIHEMLLLQGLKTINFKDNKDLNKRTFVSLSSGVHYTPGEITGEVTGKNGETTKVVLPSTYNAITVNTETVGADYVSYKESTAEWMAKAKLRSEVNAIRNDINRTTARISKLKAIADYVYNGTKLTSLGEDDIYHYNLLVGTHVAKKLGYSSTLIDKWSVDSYADLNAILRDNIKATKDGKVVIGDDTTKVTITIKKGETFEDIYKNLISAVFSKDSNVSIANEQELIRQLFDGLTNEKSGVISKDVIDDIFNELQSFGDESVFVFTNYKTRDGFRNKASINIAKYFSELNDVDRSSRDNASINVEYQKENLSGDRYTYLIKPNVELVNEAIETLNTSLQEKEDKVKELLSEDGTVETNSDYYKKLVEDSMKELRAYDKTDPTDGSTWITPFMYRQLLVRSGKIAIGDEVWNAIEYLEDDANYILPTSRIPKDQEEWERQAALVSYMPQKTMYVQNDTRDMELDGQWTTISTLVYDKMAMGILHRNIAIGTKNEDIYRRATLTGKYSNQNLAPIDHIIMDTATKTGKTPGINIHDHMVDGKYDELFYAQPVQRDWFYLRKQQEMQEHDDFDESTLGTAVDKIAYADIQLDGVYKLESCEEMTGEELRNSATKIRANLSAIGVGEVMGEFSNPGDKVGDSSKVMTYIKRAMASSGRDPESIRALETDPSTGKPRVNPNVSSNQAFISSTIMRIIHDKIARIYLPGAQLVQLSDFGFTKLRAFVENKDEQDAHDRLRMVAESYSLYGEDVPGITKNGAFTRMTCRVSVRLFKNIIPDYDNKSHSERVAWLQDHDIKRLLTYRTPTQGKSSVIAMEVVEFLGDEQADIIRVPFGFTTLTGSDFDIDKLFIAMKNYDKTGNEVKYYKDATGEAYLAKANEVYNMYRPSISAVDRMSYEDVSSVARMVRGFISDAVMDHINDIDDTSAIFDEFLTKLDEEINKNNEYYEILVGLKAAIEDKVKPNDDYHSLIDDINDVVDSIHGDGITVTQAGISYLVDLGLLPSFDEFKRLSPEEFNTKEALQNRMLDYYSAILLSPLSANETLEPLDTFTEPLKSLRNRVEQITGRTESAESGVSKEIQAIYDNGGVLSYTSLTKQRSLQNDNKTGKKGVGTTALASNIRAMFQQAGISFITDANYGLGLTKTFIDSRGKTKQSIYLGRTKAADGSRIANWFNAMLSAFVDLEKDPYIVALNVTEPLLNVVSYLTMIGLGVETFHITVQPMMKWVSNRIEQLSSKIDFEDSNEKTFFDTQRLYISLMEYRSNVLTNNEYAGFGAEGDHSIFVKKGDRFLINETYYMNNDELLRYYQDQEKALSDLNLITKFKNGELGSSEIEMLKGAIARQYLLSSFITDITPDITLMRDLILQSRPEKSNTVSNPSVIKRNDYIMRRLREEGRIMNLDKLMSTSKQYSFKEGDTYIPTIYRNLYDTLSAVMSTSYIEFTPTFDLLFDMSFRMSHLNGEDYISQRSFNERISELSAAFNAMVLSQSGISPNFVKAAFLDPNGTNKDSFTGLLADIMQYYKQVESDPNASADDKKTASIITNNKFLDGLKEYFSDTPVGSTIRMRNSRDEDVDVEAIKEAWADLFSFRDNSDKEYEKRVRQVAALAYLYLYYGYGSRYEFGDYRLYTPIVASLKFDVYDYNEDGSINYDKAIRISETSTFNDIMDALSDPSSAYDYANALFKQINDFVYKNNWANKDIVRQVFFTSSEMDETGKKKDSNIGVPITVKNTTADNVEFVYTIGMKITDKNLIKGLTKGYNAKGLPVYEPYITVRGYDPKMDKSVSTQNNVPVYNQTYEYFKKEPKYQSYVFLKFIGIDPKTKSPIYAVVNKYSFDGSGALFHEGINNTGKSLIDNNNVSSGLSEQETIDLIAKSNSIYVYSDLDLLWDKPYTTLPSETPTSIYEKSAIPKVTKVALNGTSFLNIIEDLTYETEKSVFGMLTGSSLGNTGLFSSLANSTGETTASDIISLLNSPENNKDDVVRVLSLDSSLFELVNGKLETTSELLDILNSIYTNGKEFDPSDSSLRDSIFNNTVLFYNNTNDDKFSVADVTNVVKEAFKDIAKSYGQEVANSFLTSVNRMTVKSGSKQLQTRLLSNPNENISIRVINVGRGIDGTLELLPIVSGVSEDVPSIQSLNPLARALYTTFSYVASDIKTLKYNLSLTDIEESLAKKQSTGASSEELPFVVRVKKNKAGDKYVISKIKTKAIKKGNIKDYLLSGRKSKTENYVADVVQSSTLNTSLFSAYFSQGSNFNAKTSKVYTDLSDVFAIKSIIELFGNIPANNHLAIQIADPSLLLLPGIFNTVYSSSPILRNFISMGLFKVFTDDSGNTINSYAHQALSLFKDIITQQGTTDEIRKLIDDITSFQEELNQPIVVASLDSVDVPEHLSRYNDLMSRILSLDIDNDVLKALKEVASNISTIASNGGSVRFGLHSDFSDTSVINKFINKDKPAIKVGNIRTNLLLSYQLQQAVSDTNYTYLMSPTKFTDSGDKIAKSQDPKGELSSISSLFSSEQGYVYDLSDPTSVASMKEDLWEYMLDEVKGHLGKMGALMTEQEAKKIESYKNPEVAGFTANGKIFIKDNADKREASTNTPFHEYAHMWIQALEWFDNKLYKEIIEILSDEKGLFKERVLKIKDFEGYGKKWEKQYENNPNKDTIIKELIGEEVFAYIVGDNSSAKIAKLVNDLEGDKTKSTIVQIFEKIIDSFVSFIKSVIKDYFGIEEDVSIFNEPTAITKVKDQLHNIKNEEDAKAFMEAFRSLTVNDFLNGIDAKAIVKNTKGVSSRFYSEKDDEVRLAMISKEDNSSIFNESNSFRNEISKGWPADLTDSEKMYNSLVKAITDTSNATNEAMAKPKTSTSVYYSGITSRIHKVSTGEPGLKASGSKVKESTSPHTEAGNIAHIMLGYLFNKDKAKFDNADIANIMEQLRQSGNDKFTDLNIINSKSFQRDVISLYEVVRDRVISDIRDMNPELQGVNIKDLREYCTIFNEVAVPMKDNRHGIDKENAVGIIDLLVIDKKGRAYVYDFKTSYKGFDYYTSNKVTINTSHGKKTIKKKYTTREMYKAQPIVYSTMLYNTFGIRTAKSAIIMINSTFSNPDAVAGAQKIYTDWLNNPENYDKELPEEVKKELKRMLSITGIHINTKQVGQNTTSGFDYVDINDSSSKEFELARTVIGKLIPLTYSLAGGSDSMIAKIDQIRHESPSRTSRILTTLENTLSKRYNMLRRVAKSNKTDILMSDARIKELRDLSQQLLNSSTDVDVIKKIIYFYDKTLNDYYITNITEFSKNTPNDDVLVDFLWDVNDLLATIRGTSGSKVSALTVFDDILQEINKSTGVNTRSIFATEVDKIQHIKDMLYRIDNFYTTNVRMAAARKLSEFWNGVEGQLKEEYRARFNQYAVYDTHIKNNDRRRAQLYADMQHKDFLGNGFDTDPNSALYSLYREVTNGLDNVLSMSSEDKANLAEKFAQMAIDHYGNLSEDKINFLAHELETGSVRVNAAQGLLDSLQHTSDPICAAIVNLWNKQYYSYTRDANNKKREIVKVISEFEKAEGITQTTHTVKTEKEIWSMFLEFVNETQEDGTTKRISTNHIISPIYSSLDLAKLEMIRSMVGIDNDLIKARLISEFYRKNYTYDHIISDSNMYFWKTDESMAEFMKTEMAKEYASKLKALSTESTLGSLSDATIKSLIHQMMLKVAAYDYRLTAEQRKSIGTKIKALSRILPADSQLLETPITKISDDILNKYAEAKKEHKNKDWDKFIAKALGQDAISLPTYKQKELLEKSDSVYAKVYRLFTSMSEETDMKIPPDFAIKNMLPGVRKEGTERIRDEKGNLVGFAKHQIGEGVLVKQGDTLRGTSVTDAFGNKTHYLPIHFTQTLDEEDQSYDLPSIYFAYWCMGHYYSKMSEIQSVVELTKRIVDERQYIVKNVFGEVTTEKTSFSASPLKSRNKDLSNQLDAWMNTYFYRELTNAGMFKISSDTAIDNQKLVTAINSYTSKVMLSLNKNQGIANILAGEANTFIAAAGGLDFNTKDLMRGKAIFMKLAPELFKDIGQRVPVSLPMLLMQEFDVLNEEIYGGDFTFLNRVRGMFTGETMNFFNTFGEIYMRGSAFFAMLSKIKVRDANGNILTVAKDGTKLDSVIDLYYLDEDGKLSIREVEGYSEEATKWSVDDRDRFRSKFSGVMYEIHGAYGSTEKVAIEREAFAQLMYLFRKFIVPNLMVRWAGTRYVERLGRNTGGYYRTSLHFVTSYIHDLKALKLSLMDDQLSISDKFNLLGDKFKSISPVEQANLRKQALDIAITVAMVTIGALIGGNDDDDTYDPKDKVALNIKYQAKRLAAELNFYRHVPAALDIIKSPMAATAIVEDVIDLFETIIKSVVGGGFETYKSGIYAGQPKILRQTMKLIPVIKQDYMHPKYGPQSLKQQLQFY